MAAKGATGEKGAAASGAGCGSRRPLVTPDLSPCVTGLPKLLTRNPLLPLGLRAKAHTGLEHPC